MHDGIVVFQSLAPLTGRRLVADLDRPIEGATWDTGCPHLGIRVGVTVRRGQPATALLAQPIACSRVSVYGVLARLGDRSPPAFGTITAVVAGMLGDIEVWTKQLEYCRHLVDSSELAPKSFDSGDGASVGSFGALEIDGHAFRMDRLGIEVPSEGRIDRVRVSMCHSAVEWELFEVEAGLVQSHVACPFHSSHGGVSLSEIPAIVRVGDRSRLLTALAQFGESLDVAADLDEARGQALLFVAVLTASLLERGGDRTLHRAQLQLARKLESCGDLESVRTTAVAFSNEICRELLGSGGNSSEKLVDEAMRYVGLHFTRNISDHDVANRLGLSTSHFRHLFRQASGQPFHRYLVSVRLESARKLLRDSSASVSEIAVMVGFQSPAHFSRSFAHRFGASPNQFRRMAG